MPKASVKRHIARDKQTLIDFVLDIEKYPEFIPFCIDSKVYETNDEGDVKKIIADLTIGKRPFIDTYKSDVRYDKKRKLLEKQKKGKARSKQFGRVEIPQEAFIGVLKISKEK